MSKPKKNSYKKTDFLNISNDDFESPIVFKKFKSSSDKPPQRIQKQKKPKEKQLTLHQLYEENFSYSDVNSEHLQLALALSRSTSEMFNCTTKEEFPLIPQNEGKKKTLLEFGFKTTRPKCSVENKLPRKEVSMDRNVLLSLCDDASFQPVKTNKKSKFRYITPILMMRTEEERESLIQSKLSSIIAQNAIVSPEYKHSIPEVSSGQLEKLICRECSIFNFNKKVMSSGAKFIVSFLNIERTKTKKNSLLRDWKKIPLRDHTPERPGKETSSLDGHIDHIENNHFEFSKRLSAEDKLNNDEISRVIIQSKNSNVFISPDFIQSKLNEYRDGSVSPDLFENNASFSENKVCPILYNNSEDVGKPNDIFTEKNGPDGNLPEKSIDNIGKCGENCNTSTDGKSEAFSDELTQKERNIIPHSLLEHEFEEKASLCSVFENNQRDKNKSQELYKAENSSHVDEYIVLSSDEEISPSGNFVFNLFSNVDNSISVTPQKPITSEKRSNGNSKNLSYDIDEEISLRNERDFIENDNLLKDLSSEAYIFECEKRTSGQSSDNNIRIKPDNECCLNDEEVEIPSNSKRNIEENISISDFYEDNLKLNDSFEGHNNSNLARIKLSNSFSDCDLTKINEFRREKNSSNKNDFSVLSVNSSNETFILELDTNDGEHYKKIKFETSNNSLSSNSLDLDDENILEMKLSDSFDNTDTQEKSNSELNFSLHSHDTCNEESNIMGLEGNTTEMLSDSLLNNILEENNCSYLNNNDNKSKRNSLTSNNEEKYSWYDDSNINNQDGKFQDISRSTGHESIENESEVVKEIFDPEKLSGKPTMDNLSMENNEFISNQVNTPLRKSRKSSNIHFKKYASFCEKETPKSSTFVRHKSESNITPNRKFVVKTDNVTPMIDYSTFSTPEIVQELGKFGLKPLKRKRGINLLKHIYETTHPIVDVNQSDADDAPSVKRRRSDDIDKQSANKSFPERNMSEVLQTWSGTISESDAILERQRSSKIFSCQVPLQIVWHNFLNKNPDILQNVLLYEPLQVEVIHKMLKDLGYKFHLQDLITFLDQKCITIRIAQNQRNKIA